MDISSYTIEQIKEALDSINEEKYPERADLLRRTLNEKLEDGYSRLESITKDSDDSYVPLDYVFPVWIFYTVAHAVIVFALYFVLAFVLGLLFEVLNLPPYVAFSITLMMQIVLVVIVNLLVLRRALARKYKNFEIVFLPKN